MDRKTKQLLKKSGTKKQLREAMQKKRVRGFLGQKLGTVTHRSAKAYDRNRLKQQLDRGEE